MAKTARPTFSALLLHKRQASAAGIFGRGNRVTDHGRDDFADKSLSDHMRTAGNKCRSAATNTAPPGYTCRVQLLAVGKDVSNELANLKGLRKRLRAELSESNDIEEGQAADGFAQMEAEIEAMIASYWRPNRSRGAERPSRTSERVRLARATDSPCSFSVLIRPEQPENAGQLEKYELR
jgi:hypothetical protein